MTLSLVSGHHAGVNGNSPCSPAKLHQGLCVQGEHLPPPCHGWTEDSRASVAGAEGS